MGTESSNYPQTLAPGGVHETVAMVKVVVKEVVVVTEVVVIQYRRNLPSLPFSIDSAFVGSMVSSDLPESVIVRRFLPVHVVTAVPVL